jgi:phenylalanyl-tRNA synthetase beta chain
MRVPLEWLREFVDLPADADAVAHRLAMLGFPVETIERRPHISGVVAGRITELEKHPNADRLQVARVDVGDGKPLMIVTAATNVAAGQKIGVATIGARLPELTIEPRTMRGVASEGMMVSADELALPGPWFEDGILQLDGDVPIGSNVVAHFHLDTPVFDVEITSNRADAMCVVGLARELAASYDRPLRLPSFENPGTGEPDDPLRVVLASPDCVRFVAQRFDGVRPGTSPLWMRIRLALAGQRPINRVVDVSNYVMLETGQPLHFYDSARIAGSLIVRDAKPGERLTTLDGVERELNSQALVVADAERALGLAGLMGGAWSEVTESTMAVVLEAATFNGARVRRMSAELGVRTEASSRHEKTLAPALAEAGAARAAALLSAMGARAYRPSAFGAEPPLPAPIALDAREVERLVGLTIEPARIQHHLEALGCRVDRAGEQLTVSPPLWRRDLHIAADLVEEAARMEGYERIPAAVPPVPSHDIPSTEFDLESRIAHTLAALGYNEVVTLSLHGRQLFERARKAGLAPSHQSVEVRNPLSEEQRYLRYALGPGLLEYFGRIREPVRVFEIGHVFMMDEGHVAEVPVLTFGFLAAPIGEPEWRDTNFLRIRGDCEALIRLVSGCGVQAVRDIRNGLHPGKTAVLMHQGREVAIAGRVDPRLARAYDLDLAAYLCNVYLDALPPPERPRYRAPSKFPSTYRDLALIVPLDVTAADLERVVARALGPICTGVRVFDEYHGPQVPGGSKSLAVRMTLQHYDRTITDEEADAATAAVLQAVRGELNATVRE